MRAAALLALLVLAWSGAGVGEVQVLRCACVDAVRLGKNLGPDVPGRLLAHLRLAFGHDVEGLQCSEDCAGNPAHALLLDLYLGDVDEVPRELSRAARAAEALVDSETFVLAAAAVEAGGGRIAIFANGTAYEGATAGVRGHGVSNGAVYGAYAAMERLGFAWLHPLSGPTVALHPPRGEDLLEIGILLDGPRWGVRGMHYHTQHPLELTDALQGYDLPMGCEAPPACGDGGVPCCTETFEDMARQIADAFEWCAANRLNRFQWILLGLDRWEPPPDDPRRQERLRSICESSNRFGLLCGAVVAVADKQQHFWVMAKMMSSRQQMADSIHERVAWLKGAGFDFVSTESGLSEFVSPPEELMLALLNEFARTVNETFGMEATVKVHCSTGQRASGFRDPRPNRAEDALNMNFLPGIAGDALGVLPHTVQAFALDDAAHNVYGNANFSDMFDYLCFELERGRRQVVWYGESSYWVNVDIDVPLFLPVYAQRRVRDLRLIAAKELSLGRRIAGQTTFSSGWEWTYWLNDLVAARAAWDPKLGASTDSDALEQVLEGPLRAAFGGAVAAKLAAWLARVSHEQATLLLKGDSAQREERRGDEQDSCDADGAAAGEGACGSGEGEGGGDGGGGCGDGAGRRVEVEKLPGSNARLEGLSRADASALFRDLDGDGDGLLRRGELKRGMGKLRQRGVVQRWLWASELLAGADADDDDCVDEEEFWQMLSAHRSPLRVNRRLTRAQSDALFRQLDSGGGYLGSGTKGDGRLHYGEVRKGMKTLRTAHQVGRGLWASQLLREADKDGSGYLDGDEFFLELQLAPDASKLSGLAYLSGWDTWTELPRALGIHGTQANKVLPYEWSDRSYASVLPLLKAVANATEGWHLGLEPAVDAAYEACAAGAAPPGRRARCEAHRRLLAEFDAGLQLTSLRARQVLLLYLAASPGASEEQKEGRFAAAREAIAEAAAVVRRVEAMYRVPAARVAEWRGRPDPTAYRFGYLHAVHTLYYWWRDQGRTEGKSLVARRGLCYLNRYDAMDLAVGHPSGGFEKAKAFLRSLPRVAGLEIGDCLAPPAEGFRFPDDL